MNPIRSPLSRFVVLVALLPVVAALGQVPDASPPAYDREGTEQAWDITHPGWRTWGNEPEEDADEDDWDDFEAILTPQLDEAALRQQAAAEEQRRKEQEERLRQLQVIWQQQGRQQQEAQQQQQAQQRQRIFEQAKQLLLASFQVPSDASTPVIQAPLAETGGTALPYDISFGSTAASTSRDETGLSANEWQQARLCRDLVETLFQSSDVTPEDRTMLDAAEVRRNQLWSKAVSVPGLPDDNREALALSLPVVASADTPRFTLQDARALGKTIQEKEPQASAVVLAMSSDLYISKGTDAAGQIGEETIKRLFDEDAADRFGDFLGVSKIALAVAKDGPASGISATADFLIGKIPLPQATVAIEGGRQYANLVYQVQSKFMVDAMKATGTDFDVQEFWKKFKEELSTGQKAVMEFVSYGPQN